MDTPIMNPNEAGTDILDLLFDNDGILSSEIHDLNIPKEDDNLDGLNLNPEELFSDLLTFSQNEQSPPEWDVLSSSAASPNTLSDSGLSTEELSPPDPGGSPGVVSDPEFVFTGVEDINMETIDPNCIYQTVETSSLDNINWDDVSIEMGSDGTNNVDLTKDAQVVTTISSGPGTPKIQVIKITTVNPKNSLPFTVQDLPKGQLVTTNVPAEENNDKKFPELMLTDEEKVLLDKEGVTLPTDMPLTKEEERQLKSVRRKIRNKISAKESRKRKGEYVDGLEDRVKICTKQNADLQKKVKILEQQNMTLMQQLKRFQNMITSRTTKPVQTSTCVMVLLLSFALLVLPNYNPFQNSGLPGQNMKTISPGRSRSLLYEEQSMHSDAENPYGITVKPGPPWENPPKTPVIHMPPLNKSVNDTLKGNDKSDKIHNDNIENINDNVIDSDNKNAVIDNINDKISAVQNNLKDQNIIDDDIIIKNKKNIVDNDMNDNSNINDNDTKNKVPHVDGENVILNDNVLQDGITDSR